MSPSATEAPAAASNSQTALAIFKPLSALTEKVNERVLTEGTALEKMMKMQEEGLKLNINFVIDKTGSMKDDVEKVRKGLVGWMIAFYKALPKDVKDLYGGSIKIGGSITYFKDMDFDMDKEPFVSEVIQPKEVEELPFVAQLEAFQNDDNAGGSGGSESSGEALIVGMNFDPNGTNPRANLINGLTKFVVDVSEKEKQKDAAEKFKSGCKALLESGMPPQIVILVTDELAKSTNSEWGGLDEEFSRDRKGRNVFFNEEIFIKAWESIPEKDRPTMMFFVPGKETDAKDLWAAVEMPYREAVLKYWKKFASYFGEKGFVVDLNTMKPENMDNSEDLFGNLIALNLTKVAAKVIEDQLAGLLE